MDKRVFQEDDILREQIGIHGTEKYSFFFTNSSFCDTLLFPSLTSDIKGLCIAINYMQLGNYCI